MSFIRVKKINGNEYAYLVENRWYKRRVNGNGLGSRQKVSKYLGRVYGFDKTENIDFLTFKKIEDLEEYLRDSISNRAKIIKDLIEWELFRHSINKEEFTIDFSNKKITNKKNNKGNHKEVSLKMNEGFLNSFTLSRLFGLRSGDSYHLAKCFVEAGIEIPKELFVGMFGK